MTEPRQETGGRDDGRIRRSQSVRLPGFGRQPVLFAIDPINPIPFIHHEFSHQSLWSAAMESPLSTSAERVSLSWAPDLLNASSATQSPAAPRHPKAVTPSPHSISLTFDYMLSVRTTGHERYGVQEPTLNAQAPDDKLIVGFRGSVPPAFDHYAPDCRLVATVPQLAVDWSCMLCCPMIANTV